jgi:hypothetical protein
VAGYSADGVIFEDGSEEKADVIVFCTGYVNDTQSALMPMLNIHLALETHVPAPSLRFAERRW